MVHSPSYSTNLGRHRLGLTGYHNVHGSFPPAVVCSPDGKPLYSWRVLILPYIDEQELYDAFRKDEPWDSPHNLTILNSWLSPYHRLRDMGPTLTTAQVIVGPGAAFEGRTGTKLSEFTDGASRTLLVVDASTPVPWTSPNDLAYAKDKPLPALGPTNEEDQERRGFNALFADGTTRFVDRTEVDDATLRALITRNGGERIAHVPD